MITINIVLMSGEVLPYTCRGTRGKTKYLTHKNRMEDFVINHLQLDPENYSVKILHDDDEERLQTEHNQRVERWISSGKYVSEDSKIFPGIYDYSALQSFKDQRDKIRCYQDGQIVRAFVQQFNLRKCWNELKDDN